MEIHVNICTSQSNKSLKKKKKKEKKKHPEGNGIVHILIKPAHYT